MKMTITRRRFSGLLGCSLVSPLLFGSQGARAAAESQRNFRIRTITAGVQLADSNALGPIETAIRFLKHAKRYYESKGYTVQTLRVATQPLADYMPAWPQPSALDAIAAIDRLVTEHGVVCSIGPVITRDRYEPGFGSWVAELIQRTERVSCTVNVASLSHGMHYQAIKTAGEAIAAIAASSQGGEGNFRFAATALTPPGTPFFPAAYFAQGLTFSVGLESPGLLRDVFQSDNDPATVKPRLKTVMEAALQPVERLAKEIALEAGWRYLGMDVSPAPGLNASIGEAIEALSGEPFGDTATLTACATITDVLKSLRVAQCGYCGLMLPPLEDVVLAKRAIEGRYNVSELLLYSSVCGTGIDVVPLPGDVQPKALAKVIGDVAALAVKYQKPLSARLFPVPGKRAGDMVSFDNPLLSDAVVMSLG